MEERLRYLFQRYLDNTCTRKEFEEFLAYVSDAGHDATIRALIKKVYEDAGKDASTHTYVDESGNLVLTQPDCFVQSEPAPTRGPKKLMSLLAIAAGVIIVAGYFWFKKDTPAPTAATAQAKLTRKSTGRSEYKYILLPDSTQVWLNAASHLDFPQRFSNEKRIVKLSGEAYFEVAKKTGMPFSVKMNGMSIDVLGTHFNVMGYDDEAFVKTTLLEGSVQVTKGNSKALLKPGQEANANNTGEKIKVATADVEQATAWKNGMFLFNKTDIKSIMRQLSRWYDFEVKYEGSFENRNFSGLISRKTELSKVLKMLQMTKDVRFKVEGRSVTVL